MFDVLTVAALCDELGRRLIGGRIQRVIQLDDVSVGLELYADRQRVMLVASADRQNPRLHLSPVRLSADPDRVTPLLLLLRKYARGGQLVAVEQPPLERVARLSIAKRFWPHKRGAASDDAEDLDLDESDDDGAELVYTHLIVELMGRRSNVILTDDDGRILDSARRVTPEMSRVRPVLPGRTYQPPPPQAKADPRGLSAAALDRMLDTDQPGDLAAAALVRDLAAMSPQMAREVVFQATGQVDATVAQVVGAERLDAMARALATVLAPLESGQWEPSVYRWEDRPPAFAATRQQHLADAEEERFDSMSRAVERWLELSGQAEPVRHSQRRVRLVGQIDQARQRAEARVHSLEEERERMEQGERWRQMGEAIYAHLYELRRGEADLQVDGMVIPLDPTRSPSENAQEYFERYRKARSATENLPELIERARVDRDYLAQLATLADLSDSMENLEQVRREWEQLRPPRPGQAGAKPRRAAMPRRPVGYRTERGDIIYVGRNGPQNDLVTFDIAGPDDMWLHARGVPGSHVLVHWAGPEDERTVERAAALAAHFSGARGSTTVEVDATQRRFVRKIKGSGPGMVTYRNEQTLSVHPRGPEELGLH
ncbi:MAG TPA: NFACT family protein [Thermomicrobiaceae bacterium]|nr:NFACT family protein [Thermomicrobiaceae bacterium]